MYALSNVRKAAAALAIAGLMGTLVAGVVPTLAAADSPSVTLSSTSASSTNDNPIIITASGLDASSTLSAAEVNVTGGTAGNFSGSTFTITPGDGDPNHANQPITVTVSLHPDAADDNASSNTLTFNYLATAPNITITGGPANGSTVTIPSGQTNAPVEFTFTSDDSSATYQCFVGDASSTPAPWSCGSPQDYTLGASNSYMFQVTATNGVGSNTTTIDFSVVAATSSSADTNVPVINISSGPADGSTVNPADASFNFTVDDPNATVQCSMVAATSSDSFTACTSPQSFTSSTDGAYRFTIQASNNAGTASSTVNFTVSSTTAAAGSSSSSSGSGSSASSVQTTSPSTSTGGGATGNGNNGSFGVPAGHTVVPSGGTVALASGSGSSGAASTGAPTGNAVIPTAPVTTTQTIAPGTGTSLTSGAPTHTTVPSTHATPVVSQSSGGSALVAANVPTGNTSGAVTVTPGVPNTGSASTSAVSSTSGLGTSSSLAAAAAGSGDGIPGWVWLIIAAIVIIAIGIWALRQPA